MKRAKAKRPVARRPHLVLIRDADGRTERLKARDRHAAFGIVRQLAVRRVLVNGLTEAQREAAFWKLNRVTIRAAAVR